MTGGPSDGWSCARRAPRPGSCWRRPAATGRGGAGGPPGAQTGLLLAQADGDRQAGAVGDQFAGRVGLFLRVDDFDETYERMVAHGVEFAGEPRDEEYGRVVVFTDISGNRWDLLGPR